MFVFVLASVLVAGAVAGGDAVVGGAVAGVLLAVGGVLKIVFDHLRKRETQHDAAMQRITELAATEAKRHEDTVERLEERFEKFLTNHMETNTRAMRDVEAALRALKSELHFEMLRRGGARVDDSGE